MAIYAGVGGAGLVGGHMAYGAIKDKVVDHKQAKTQAAMVAEAEAKRVEKIRMSAIDKGIDPDSRFGQKYMDKGFFGRMLTRGR